MIHADNGTPRRPLSEAIFLACDDYSIPFRTGMELHLIPGKDIIARRPDPVVVPLGAPGAPDDKMVKYYGSVLRVGDELWMWYLGNERICLARSRNGIAWEKPALGLVEHNGSTANNLVRFPIEGGIGALVVLHESQDPDPKRRFKMVCEAHKYRDCLSVAYSEDGLTWHEPAGKNPAGPWIEMSGLVNLNGTYYVTGQGHMRATLPLRSRRLLVLASGDFENWLPAFCLGMDRTGRCVAPNLEEDSNDCWPQVHLGAALHDRGTTLLGIYGQWHEKTGSGGEKTGSGAEMMDLGLCLSQDALHYREPLKDFRFIPARWEAPTLSGGLQQGQGMENIGEKTLYWYSVWLSPGTVRVASWPRDRFSFLKPFSPPYGPHLLATCLFTLDAPARVSLNAEVLGRYPEAGGCSELRVEVLDAKLNPVPGFTLADCAPVRDSGLDAPVRWGARETLPADRGPMHLKLVCGGNRPEDIRLFAICIR